LFGFKFNINIYLKYGFVGRRDLNKGLFITMRKEMGEKMEGDG
jgi:hypothetical protein